MGRSNKDHDGIQTVAVASLLCSNRNETEKCQAKPSILLKKIVFAGVTDNAESIKTTLHLQSYLKVHYMFIKLNKYKMSITIMSITLVYLEHVHFIFTHIFIRKLKQK